MSALADKSAFPGIVGHFTDRDLHDKITSGGVTYSEGMTLRQHYSGLAMQAIVSAPTPFFHDESGATADTWPIIAECAVQMADALLTELERTA